jgi:O-antigen/teichoic acid export membrane protein
MGEPTRIGTALRGFSISTALRVGRLVVSLVLTSFLARHLGQDGFGQLMVGMSLVAVLLCASELGFNRITVRELVKDDAAGWQTLGATFYSRLMLGMLLYAGLVTYVLLAKPEIGLLLLIYGALLLTHAGTEVMAWFESGRKVESVAWAQFAGFAVSGVCIAAGLLLDAPLWFYALTYNIECWFALGLVIAAFHRKGGRMRQWRWSWTRAVALIRESKYELATQLALLLLFRLDMIMVEALRGKGEAGIYGAAVLVSEVVYFIPVILSSVCLPPLLELRRTDAVRYRQRFGDYFAMSLLIAVPCAALLAFASPLIVSVLFGKDFTASAPILVIHAWSFIPYAIGIARTQYLTAEGRLWVNLPSVVLALGVNAALNWLWIPQHGGEGAAWATLVAYSVAWVLSSFTLPGTRDVARLIVQSVTQMPAFIAQSWRHLRVASARG